MKLHTTIHTSVTDMMSGLMMIFLFIAIAYMLEQEAITKDIKRQNQAMVEIAKVAERSRNHINQDLRQEFTADFTRWNVQLLDDNSVRFKAPDVLFEPGKAKLKPKYQKILQQFFPRYVAILYQHRDDIKVIRIEGHTSSDWGEEQDLRKRFEENFKLSQNRARETLLYSFRLIQDPAQAQWLQGVLMAAGRSFGQLLYQPNTQNEDSAASRRVEFKLITRAEEQLGRILEQARSAGSL
ncbi:hypothetical protein TI05_11330 [Achromatium sp. WMS3]|nr:hypothetical protein TI05_11330 [Achromatium sp. WMS3]